MRSEDTVQDPRFCVIDIGPVARNWDFKTTLKYYWYFTAIYQGFFYLYAALFFFQWAVPYFVSCIYLYLQYVPPKTGKIIVLFFAFQR